MELIISIIAWLCYALYHALAQNQQVCSSSTECPTGLACFPDPILQGNRTLSTSHCYNQLNESAPYLDNSNLCKPTSTIPFNQTVPADCQFCCRPGLSYRTFVCSPMSQNDAVLLVTAFNLSNPGSLRSCTSSSWNNQEPLVALASNWENGICQLYIDVTARIVTALVVAECYTSNGCLAESSFQPPCPPNAIAANEEVWRMLGYDPEAGIVRNISWNLNKTGGVPTKSRRKNYMAVIAGTVVAALLLLLLSGILAANAWKRARKRTIEAQELMQEMRLEELHPQQFSYRDLKAATRNFASEFILGAGGFGSVFKGELADGSLVAVKRMDIDIQGSSKGHSQFKAEVMSIGSIHHFNLVKLRGFCIRGPAALLVYEFMPNGSLDKWIFAKNEDIVNDITLDWNQRHSIAIDVARGLTYLHEGCREQVLHLDIKPQNILLDQNLRARISDFGLSKLAERGKSQVVTVMRGTPGYMAPEWLHTKVTDKTDVYSFGIVLLELVSSKRTVQFHDSSGQPFASSSSSSQSCVRFLGETALCLFHAGNVAELIDDKLFVRRGSCEGLEVADAERYVKIGLWCIQERPERRPAMKTVLDMLEGNVDVLDLPPLSDTGSSRLSFQPSRYFSSTSL